MWMSLICAMRKPSSARGQRGRRSSTRTSFGGRSAAASPAAPATATTASATAACVRAPLSNGSSAPPAAYATPPPTQRSRSVAASTTRNSHATPIQIDAGQPTRRFQGGRTRRSANGCAISTVKPNAIAPSPTARAAPVRPGSNTSRWAM